MTILTDEILMAFVDGELTREDARRVEIAAEQDPEIRRRLETFEKTRDLLQVVSKEKTPIPSHLQDSVVAMIQAADRPRSSQPAGEETQKVVPFSRPKLRSFVPAALAASVTLVIGLAAGVSFTSHQTSPTTAHFGVAELADPDIAPALSVIASGSTEHLKSGAVLNVIASFENSNGNLCREFDYESTEGTSIVSVACHSDGQWLPKIAILTGGTAQTAYAPASSLDALESWVTSYGLGDPLDAEAEQKMLTDIK